MVSQSQTRIRMTAAEFLQLPETTQRMELIHGELVTYGDELMSPAPELNHQRIVVQLVAMLVNLALPGDVFTAPTDVHLDDSTVVQPDVLWVSPDNTSVADDGKRLRGAPDLVIEVLSPGTAQQDKTTKFKLYEQSGVREYWIVDPVYRLVDVWTLTEGVYRQQGVYGVDDGFESGVLGQKPIDLKVILTT
jgi:Uma2 family endonuclease